MKFIETAIKSNPTFANTEVDTTLPQADCDINRHIHSGDESLNDGHVAQIISYIELDLSRSGRKLAKMRIDVGLNKSFTPSFLMIRGQTIA